MKISSLLRFCFPLGKPLHEPPCGGVSSTPLLDKCLRKISPRLPRDFSDKPIHSRNQRARHFRGFFSRCFYIAVNASSFFKCGNSAVGPLSKCSQFVVRSHDRPVKSICQRNRTINGAYELATKKVFARYVTRVLASASVLLALGEDSVDSIRGPICIGDRPACRKQFESTLLEKSSILTV